MANFALMVIISQKHSFPLGKVLFTFALSSEASDLFVKYNHLICGIGKVNATYNLLKASGQIRHTEIRSAALQNSK